MWLLHPDADLQPLAPYLLPELLVWWLRRLRTVDRQLRLRLRRLLQRSVLRNPLFHWMLRSLHRLQRLRRLRSNVRRLWWMWRLRRGML